PEALARLPLLAVEQQRLLYQLHHLVLRVDAAYRRAQALRLAPDAAYVHRKAPLLLLDAVERPGPDALAAVRALLPVDDQVAVLVLARRVHRALRHDSALLTCVAAVLVVVRHALPDDAEVVQARLHAVVRAAADADLELVRQLHAVPAEVELVV